MGANSLNIITVILDSDLILYFTGFKVEDGFLVLRGDDKFLFTDKRYYFEAKNKASATVLLIEECSLQSYILNNEIKSVGIVEALTPVSFYKELLSYGVTVFDDSESINGKRLIKTNKELELIKSSCAVLEKSLTSALKDLKEGMTELEFAGLIEYNFKLNGGERPSFETIVAFGAGSAIPHYKTSNVKLKEGMPVLIDCGVMVNGYASDITRSFYFGKAPKRYLEAHSAVLNAHLNAFNNITDGTVCVDADGFARNYLAERGYKEYFTHSLGHGVGVKVHEAPRVSIKSNEVIRNNCVFTIEPGVYFDGEFGIRIEDTVYVKDGKVVSLFNMVKDVAELIPHAK